MATTLLIMVIVDLENYFIPNATQISLAILAIIYHLNVPNKHSIPYYFYSSFIYFIAAVALYYSFWIATKKQGIGGDDLKFLAVAGLALGLDKFIIFMILSGLFGTIFGIIWTKIARDKTFPFAPALSLSFLLCLLFKIDYIKWFGTAFYLFEKYILKTAY
jgi:prepilin signal peptidase PulO-like enzyme (type II secretory pathway)